MNRSLAYNQWQDRQLERWESLCHHCGACCGASEDPCEYLVQNDDKTYVCRIYARRFGRHKTIGGQELNCVPIRDKLAGSWPGDEQCGYKMNRRKTF